jgi:cell division septum initiation protein DivIVA
MSKNKRQLEAEAAEAELQRMYDEQEAAKEKAKADAEAEVAAHNANLPPDNAGDPPVTPAAAPPPPTQLPPTSDWEQRYRSLQGMFAKANEANAELRGRVEELSSRVNQVTTPAAPAPAGSTRLLSDDEVKDYGEEFIDVTKRAAREVFDGKVQDLEKLVHELQQRVAQQDQTVTTVSKKTQEREQEVFYDALDSAVPNWEEINRDQKFLTWLQTTDMFTGSSRHALLNQAFNVRDSARVAVFFKAFADEQKGAAPPPTTPVVDAASLVSPDTISSGQNPTQPRRGKLWTQAEIEKIYDDKMKGKITHDRYLELEKEALTALAEGRVR